MTKHTFHIQIPSIYTIGLAHHMLNEYEQCFNTTNYPIFNMQEFKYWLCSCILDCFCSNTGCALAFWTILVQILAVLLHFGLFWFKYWLCSCILDCFGSNTGCALAFWTVLVQILAGLLHFGLFGSCGISIVSMAITRIEQFTMFY